MVTRVNASRVSQATPASRASASATSVAASAMKDAAQHAAQSVQKNVRRAVTGTLGLSGERMSRVDTAWLRMDSSQNLMMIVGVWIIKPGISHEALCGRVENSLLKFRRFKQRVVEDTAGATWVDDKNFDLSKHVVIEKLPKVAKGHEQRALQDRVGELAMQPLDPKRPLWQFNLVEDFEGGSVLIVRIHHCIADGIALIAVSMSMVDGGAQPPERAPKAPKRSGLEGAEDWFSGPFLHSLTNMAVKALGKTGDGLAGSLGMLGDPQKGVAGSVHLAQMAYQLTKDAAALALMDDDSPTRLKGTPGTQKRVAWCQPIPLDEVKAALGGRYAEEFSGIEPNPTYETLMKAVSKIKANKLDYLLAVGGGSVIDGTKFVAAAVYAEGDPWEILLQRGANVKQAMPYGTVLTLPATGSEMNDGSVISRTETASGLHDKLHFTSEHVFPQFSVLDPSKCYSLPPRQLANGVVDAYTHIMEQYLTYPVEARVQDRFAEGLLK